MKKTNEPKKDDQQLYEEGRTIPFKEPEETNEATEVL